MSDEQEVSLENLSNGAAVELFNRELEKALENVLDVNTVATQKREVTLKLTIKPNEDREVGLVALAVTSKLASFKPVDSMIYIGKRNGKAVAKENNPRQPSFFAADATHANN